MRKLLNLSFLGLLVFSIFTVVDTNCMRRGRFAKKVRPRVRRREIARDAKRVMRQQEESFYRDPRPKVSLAEFRRSKSGARLSHTHRREGYRDLSIRSNQNPFFLMLTFLLSMSSVVAAEKARIDMPFSASLEGMCSLSPLEEDAGMCMALEDHSLLSPVEEVRAVSSSCECGLTPDAPSREDILSQALDIVTLQLEGEITAKVTHKVSASKRKTKLKKVDVDSCITKIKLKEKRSRSKISVTCTVKGASPKKQFKYHFRTDDIENAALISDLVARMKQLGPQG